MWSLCEFFLKVLNYLLEFQATKGLFYSSFCKAENHLIKTDFYPKQTQGILRLKI